MGGPLHRVPGDRRPRAAVSEGGPLVTIDAVRAAAERLAGITVRTPLVAFGPPEARQFLKAESLQPIGAFKLRGAYNAIATLDPEAREPRRHHLLVGQPRPGGGPRCADRGHARGRGHARVMRRGSSASGSKPTARRSSSSGPPRTNARRWPNGSPRNAAWPSSRRSMTTGSSPDRARSASRSRRTCRTWRVCSCPSAAAGWPAASRWRSRRCGPRVG